MRTRSKLSVRKEYLPFVRIGRQTGEYMRSMWSTNKTIILSMFIGQDLAQIYYCSKSPNEDERHTMIPQYLQVLIHFNIFLCTLEVFRTATLSHQCPGLEGFPHWQWRDRVDTVSSFSLLDSLLARCLSAAECWLWSRSWEMDLQSVSQENAHIQWFRASLWLRGNWLATVSVCTFLSRPVSRINGTTMKICACVHRTLGRYGQCFPVPKSVVMWPLFHATKVCEALLSKIGGRRCVTIWNFDVEIFLHLLESECECKG